jgi:hypothetical protein
VSKGSSGGAYFSSCISREDKIEENKHNQFKEKFINQRISLGGRKYNKRLTSGFFPDLKREIQYKKVDKSFFVYRCPSLQGEVSDSAKSCQVSENNQF